MKLFLITIFFGILARGCQPEAEAEQDDATKTEVGIDAAGKNLAFFHWQQFKKDARLKLIAAENEISLATNALDDRQTQNKMQLQARIFHAENLLERLCEKQARSQRYDVELQNIDDTLIRNMENFEEDYKILEAHLDRAIGKLHSKEFKK